MSDEPAAINKPKGPSPTAEYAPTEHSKSVEERLGQLRSDLRIERDRHRRLVANVVAAILGIVVIGGEISAVATGLIAHREHAVAIVFAISSGCALGGILLAFARINGGNKGGALVGRWCFGLHGLAVLLGVAGAFIAAWPR
jgi:hypothetical protein